MVPPPLVRVIFFFDDGFSNLGWEETMFSNIGNVTLTMAAAKALAPLRCAWLRIQCNMIRIRCELIGTPRVFISQPPADSGVIQGGYAGTQACPTQQRLRVQFTQAPGRLNFIEAAGLDEADFTNENFKPTIPFLTPFNAWASSIIANSTTWCTLNRITNVPPNVPVNVSSVTPNGARGNTVLAQSTAGLTYGSVVRFRFPARSIQGLKGYKVVESVDSATTFTIGGVPVVGQLPVAPSCTYGNVSFSFGPITAIAGIKRLNRKTGRPFGLPAGKAPSAIPLRQ